jgi:YD repeat-containing protein
MARARHVALSLLGVITFAVALTAQSPIRYVYDELGRLVGVIDASGDAAAYHYDAVGNLLSITRSTSTTVAIIEFTPDAGPIGQTVTIYGTGFSATVGQNTVTFNGTTASISSASTTQLVVTVPSAATTGTIAVSSPNGSDTSDTAFAVTAAGAPTITSFTPTSGVAGASVAITGTNFDASAPANNPSRFNLTSSGPTAATSTTVTAPVPHNAGSGRLTVRTAAGTAVSTDDFIIPPPPFVVSDVASASRFPFGTATTVTVATASKIALRLFDGTVGQRVSLLGTNGLSGQVFGCDLQVTILNPFGSALAPAACMEQSGFLDLQTLTAAGTYTILVDPVSTATGSVTLTLYDVPADFSASITPGGSPVTATMSTPGQNGALTFSGTSGQRISLAGTNGLIGQIFGCDVGVSVLKPDGSVLVAPSCMEGSGYIDVVTLPTTGTYKIVVDPASTATGSLTLTLYNVPADYSNTITAGGSAVTVSMPTPGQNGAVTFSGTSGQRISLMGTNGLIGYVLGCDVNVSILKPDTTVLVANTCMEGSGYIDVTTLPATGTYTIVVDPVSLAVGNLTLTLNDVPADYSGTITAGGSAVTVSMPTQGQNGALTFSGTSGQRISLVGTNGLTGFHSLACDVNVRILKPDTSVLVANTCMEATGFTDVTTVPTTGTYTIVVDPVGHAFGNVTLTLYDVPADYSNTITAGGSAVTVSMPTPGQNGALTFSGTSGQRISLAGTNGLTGFIGFACDVNVRILNPNTSVLAANTCMEGSGFIDVTTLPTTGTYTIVVDPVSHAVGNVTLTLYDVPADTTGTVTIGGAAVGVTLGTPGQVGRLTFSGTASQQVTVRMASNTYGSVTVQLLNPAGTQITSATSSSASFNLSTQTLPTTGTYTIVVNPAGTNTGTVNVNVTNP